MRLGQKWLDETRGLRWIMIGAGVFAPCAVYIGMVFVFSQPGSALWNGLQWAVYGALAGATVGITGWLRLLLSRLLRIGR